MTVPSKRIQPADRQLLEYIFKLSQDELHKLLFHYLSKYYKNPVQTEDYIYAEGNIPIALVAHLDTVFDNPPKHIFFDHDQDVMWSPNGMGADDRAGVFAIIKIISHGFRPHIIFTHDEELGGDGAFFLGENPIPFDDLRYIIELDRQGIDDCVFYDCGNETFYNYVESFGFQFARGSFTDISFICPKWDIAGVNLSVGYVNEHTPQEHLFCEVLLDTVNKVENMLCEDDIPHFKYEGKKLNFDQYSSAECDCCHKKVSPHTGVKIVNGGHTAFYCHDCLEKVNWCSRCGAPYRYEFEDLDSHPMYCPNCYENIIGGSYDF